MKPFKDIYKNSENKIAGIAAAPGIVIGKVYLFTKEKLEIVVSDIVYLRHRRVALCPGLHPKDSLSICPLNVTPNSLVDWEVAWGTLEAEIGGKVLISVVKDSNPRKRVVSSL